MRVLIVDVDGMNQHKVQKTGGGFCAATPSFQGFLFGTSQLQDSSELPPWGYPRIWDPLSNTIDDRDHGSRSSNPSAITARQHEIQTP